MPKRYIDSSILINPRFNKLSIEARELFIRLLLVADTMGRFRADPEYVRVVCYPASTRENISTESVSSSLKELSENGSVALYQVDGEAFGEMPSYTKYNNFTHKKSHLPGPNVPTSEVEKLNLAPTLGQGSAKVNLNLVHNLASISNSVSISNSSSNSRPGEAVDGVTSATLVASSEGEPRQEPGATDHPTPSVLVLAYAVADQLRESVLRHNPKHRCANALSWQTHLRRQWADALQVAHTEDGRAFGDLLRLAEWLPDAPRRGKDRFCWADVVSDAVSLREKFDELWVEMEIKTADSGASASSGAYPTGVAGLSVNDPVHPDLERRMRQSREDFEKSWRKDLVKDVEAAGN